jgi:tetratricopeptide (TPR) repeat protein
MKLRALILNCVVASFVATAAIADDAEHLQRLHDRLAAAQDAGEADRIAREIQLEWDSSGSAAADLLLQRGRDAMAAKEWQLAIEHLTALTDHAPDFAEGWNARATAFYMAGEFGPSVDDIARTLTLNPRHWGALSGLAAILESMGDDEKAAEAYRAALAIHPFLDGLEEHVTALEAKLQGQEL